MAVMLWKWEKNNQKIKKVYSDWANFYLERAGHRSLINDLQLDVCNGVLLARVIEAVIGDKLTVNSHPKTASQMIDNIEGCLYYLTIKGVNTQGLLAKDIKDGNLKSILGLFFALSRFKQLQQKAIQENSRGGQECHYQPPQRQPSKPTVPPRVSSVPTQERGSIPPIQPPKAIPGSQKLVSQAASRQQRSSGSTHPRVTVSTTPSPSQAFRPLPQHPKVTVLPSHHQQSGKAQSIEVEHLYQSILLPSTSSRQVSTSKARSPTGRSPVGRSHVTVSAQIRIAPAQTSVSQASATLKASTTTTTTDMASKIPTPKSAKVCQGSKLVPPSTNVRQGEKIRAPSCQPAAHTQGDDGDTGKVIENGSSIKPPVNINTIPKKIPNPRSPTPTSRIVVNKIPPAMQQQNAKQNNTKNSMLTKLKFFGKENAGTKEKSSVKEKTDSIPKTPPSKLKTKDVKGKPSGKEKSGREIPQRKVNNQNKGGFKTKSESNSSIGTTGSNTSSSSAMNSPTSSAGPTVGCGIQKKTGQKAIPRPVTGLKARDSPVSHRRELEKPSSGRSSRRSSNSSAFSDESYDTKSSISSPQTRVKKSGSRLPSPGQRTTSAGSKKSLLVKTKTNASASPQSSSTPAQATGRSIPRPGGSGIKTGLKPPVNYQTLPKKKKVPTATLR